MKYFFAEFENILNEALSKGDNIIVLGDINIDSHNTNDDGFKYLKSICDTFNLKNLVKEKTCFAKTQGTSIDIILTNRPRSFHNTSVCETGLSDHHLMISTFLKSHLVRLKPKKIIYRIYKKFEESAFLRDVKDANFNCDTKDPNLNYENLVNVFRSIIDKHAPLKQKTVRGNEAPL